MKEKQRLTFRTWPSHVQQWWDFIAFNNVSSRPWTQSHTFFAQRDWIVKVGVEMRKIIYRRSTLERWTGEMQHMSNSNPSIAVLRDPFSTGICLKYASKLCVSQRQLIFLSQHVLLVITNYTAIRGKY